MSKIKTKLDYTVRTTKAPGESADSWTPMIVDRLQPIELAGVIEKCIDRSLIAGIKPTAASMIATGIAEQMAYEFSQGRGVQFGQYFYGRPYLSGTVSGDGRLAGDNLINVRLYKGNDFKLTRDDFSLNYVDGGNNPKISFIVSDAEGVERGTVVKGKSVKVNGEMLYGAGDTDKVVFTDAEGHAVEVTSFDAISAQLISFTCPDALVADAKYDVTVERTDENGVKRVSRAKAVMVKAGATPPVGAPDITGACTRGDEDTWVNLEGGTLDVTGTNLETATSIDLLDGEGELWHTVEATYADGKLTATVNFDNSPGEGAIRVTTAGGSDTFDVTFYHN